MPDLEALWGSVKIISSFVVHVGGDIGGTEKCSHRKQGNHQSPVLPCPCGEASNLDRGW